MHRCIERPGGDATDGKLWLLASNIAILPLVSPMFVLSPVRAGEAAMLTHVLASGSVSASDAARNLHLHIQNASNKLRNLWEQGYILREEQCARSGGREYTYFKIV